MFITILPITKTDHDGTSTADILTTDVLLLTTCLQGLESSQVLLGLIQMQCSPSKQPTCMLAPATPTFYSKSNVSTTH